MNRKIALYFGSFNPIHNGHLSIANYMIDHQLCEEVWYVVSPQNPFKQQNDLINEQDRLQMAVIAAGEWRDAIKVSDIEFSMNRPSYSIRTIQRFCELYPNDSFVLLMGEDNILFFDNWKQWIEIATICDVVIYPRGAINRMIVEDKIRELCHEGGFKNRKFNYLTHAPRINISSTEIRERACNGETIEHYTAKGVVDYIKERKLYDRK